MGLDYVPTFGNHLFPCVGVGYWQTVGMRPRAVLARNLKKLMAAVPDAGTFPAITALSGGELSNGTLDRIRRAANGTSVDNLLPLAEVFGVRPAQLLEPDLDPKVIDGILVVKPGHSSEAQQLARLLDEIRDPAERKQAWFDAQTLILQRLQGLPTRPTGTPGQDSIPETPPAPPPLPASAGQRTPARTRTGQDEPRQPQASASARKDRQN